MPRLEWGVVVGDRKNIHLTIMRLIIQYGFIDPDGMAPERSLGIKGHWTLFRSVAASSATFCKDPNKLGQNIKRVSK
jgi:hypothetical protein